MAPRDWITLVATLHRGRPAVRVENEPSEVDHAARLETVRAAVRERLALIVALLTRHGRGLNLADHRDALLRYPEQWNQKSYNDFASQAVRTGLLAGKPPLASAPKSRSMKEIAPFSLAQGVGVRIDPTAQAFYARLFEDADTHAQRAWADLRSRAEHNALFTRRQRLRPETLPAIRRTTLEERIRPLVVRALAGERADVAAITAPAGYGKTTCLGQVYDLAREHQDHGWIGAISADALGDDSERVDDALVAALVGERLSFSDFLLLAEGPGLVLIDTIDLLLSQDTAKSLSTIVQMLRERGVSTILTCRDWEFGVFLARHFSSSVRFQLGLFSSEEAMQAAAAFLDSANADAQPRHMFMERVARLLDRSGRIERILRNPLLLSFVCELYGATGDIPGDLTALKLYDQLVARKILGSRRRESDENDPDARRRQEICLRFAQFSYERSTDRLNESLLRVDIVRPEDEGAYADLRSESILEAIGPGDLRVRFFHQTFLEYWIGLWLTTDARRADDLILRVNVQRHQPLFIAHLLQAYLALLPHESFVAAVARIRHTVGPEDVLIHRAIAMAWAFHRADAAVDRLLDAQVIDSPVLQEALVDALELRPDLDDPNVQDFALSLADALDVRLVRRGLSTLCDCAVHASSSWAASLVSILAERSRSDADLLSIFATELDTRDSRFRDTCLVHVARHYQSLGTKAKAAVLRAYATVHDPEARATFLKHVDPMTYRHDLNIPMSALLAAYVADMLADVPEHAAWQRLVALLESTPGEWSSPMSFAAGRWTADHPHVLRRAIEELAVGETVPIRSMLNIVRGACDASEDSRRMVATMLTDATDRISDERIGPVTRLLRDVFSAAGIEVPSELLARVEAAGLGEKARNALVESETESLEELLARASSHRRRVALEAVRLLAQRFHHEQGNLSVSHQDLLRLLSSPVVGVRAVAFELVGRLRLDSSAGRDVIAATLAHMRTERQNQVFVASTAPVRSAIRAADCELALLEEIVDVYESVATQLRGRDGATARCLWKIWETVAVCAGADAASVIWRRFEPIFRARNAGEGRDGEKHLVPTLRYLLRGAEQAMMESLALADDLPDANRRALGLALHQHDPNGRWLQSFVERWPEIAARVARDR